MIDLDIRSASRLDADILTSIHAEGFSHYWDASAFNDFFSTDGTQALIAYRESHPTGMVVYRVSGEQADIITIVVRAALRKQGIARALLACAMSGAKAMGAQAMFLDVEDGNIAALQLYLELGFTQINRRKLYYRQKDGSYTDALVMAGKL
jgi:[ribosomal protein S18]-alanine N-acetyltransferase